MAVWKEEFSEEHKKPYWYIESAGHSSCTWERPQGKRLDDGTIDDESQPDDSVLSPDVVKLQRLDSDIRLTVVPSMGASGGDGLKRVQTQAFQEQQIAILSPDGRTTEMRPRSTLFPEPTMELPQAPLIVKWRMYWFSWFMFGVLLVVFIPLCWMPCVCTYFLEAYVEYPDGWSKPRDVDPKTLDETARDPFTCCC